MEDNKPYLVEDYIPIDTESYDVQFASHWVIWYQNKRKKWSTDNIYPYYEFYTLAGLSFLMSQIKFDPNIRIIIMRKGIKPVWEDCNNIYGGYSEIYLNVNKSETLYNIFWNCLFGLAGETFTKEGYDSLNISGFTFVNNTKLKKLRFWISNKEASLNESNIQEKYLKLFGQNISVIGYIPFDILAGSTDEFPKDKFTKHYASPKGRYKCSPFSKMRNRFNNY